MKGRIPDEQSALRNEIDRTLIVLRIIFAEDDEKFKHYFRQLLGIAQQVWSVNTPSQRPPSRLL